MFGGLGATVALVLYAHSWYGSEQAVSYTGTGSTAIYRLAQLKPIDGLEYDPASDAPPTFGWHRGGSVYLSFFFHNSLSVPITITGVSPGPDYPQSVLVGPQLRRPRPGVSEAYDVDRSRPASSVHVSAGGDVELDLLWRAASDCRRIAKRAHAHHALGRVDSVTIHYRMLGFLSKSEMVLIGDPGLQTSDGFPSEAFEIEGPNRTQCPVGFTKHLA